LKLIFPANTLSGSCRVACFLYLAKAQCIAMNEGKALKGRRKMKIVFFALFPKSSRAARYEKALPLMARKRTIQQVSFRIIREQLHRNSNQQKLSKALPFATSIYVCSCHVIVMQMHVVRSRE